MSEEKSFEQMIDESIKTIHTGEIVEGTVISVKPDEIVLNIGYKSDGIITKEEFETLIEMGEFLEYARYVDNYYGTPKAYVEEQLKKGKDVILEIEIQGALNIKKLFPTALLLFVMPPSAKELKDRLVGRGTETPEVIDKRMRRAAEESEGIENYDYIVINDKVDQ